MANIQGALVLSGHLDGKPWQTALDLGQARSAQGVERLWARNKIAALEESRVRGTDADTIDKAVLGVALTHHLTSRLTSLVAVDITPSRPADAPLASRHVPLNLPAGWDFDKVFGEHPAGSATPTPRFRMNCCKTLQRAGKPTTPPRSRRTPS